MRKAHNGKVNDRVMSAIGRNYSKLKEKLLIEDTGNYCSESMEDIFHDTIQYVIQDEAASGLTTDKEIMTHFLYRYRMIKFQRIMDDRAMKEVGYTEYKEPEASTGSSYIAPI